MLQGPLACMLGSGRLQGSGAPHLASHPRRQLAVSLQLLRQGLQSATGPLGLVAAREAEAWDLVLRDPSQG